MADSAPGQSEYGLWFASRTSREAQFASANVEQAPTAIASLDLLKNS
ncbi:hypothetical protein [Sphingopyxis fribergensis]|nr:hypothetical protein [Sphingopyxis fribergensis]